MTLENNYSHRVYLYCGNKNVSSKKSATAPVKLGGKCVVVMCMPIKLCHSIISFLYEMHSKSVPSWTSKLQSCRQQFSKVNKSF